MQLVLILIFILYKEVSMEAHLGFGRHPTILQKAHQEVIIFLHPYTPVRVMSLLRPATYVEIPILALPSVQMAVIQGFSFSQGLILATLLDNVVSP